MNVAATGRELERFRTAIVQRIGLQFDDARLGFLGEVLQRRLEKLARPGDAYLRSLEQQPPLCEMSALAQELTVGETYFFRNSEQFRALADVVLPARMRAGPQPRMLRLMSAGCASGEEAYSMAMVAREAIAGSGCEFAIRAIDLNSDMLAKAARARYAPWALRETPADILSRWFRPEGRDMMVQESIRAAVTFEAANLAGDEALLWQPCAYDVIFCRNVLMYFAPDQMRATVARIARSLVPGGFLFLGHAETLRGISDAFHLRHTHGTFYYERRREALDDLRADGPALAPRRPAVPDAAAAALAAAAVAAAALLGSGEDARGGAGPASIAARMPAAALASTPAVAAPECAAPPPFDAAIALDLLRRERFAEALACVRRRSSAADGDADVLLLEATLLAHSGAFAAAEDTALRLLQIDELNAGAHYVLALCRQHAGDRGSAGEHDRIAAYLDPAFAMPRLHLGLLARQAGDRDAARRELAQAQVLLRREDASRLVLFGGGFSREALIALCDFAFRECGERP